MHCKDSSVFFSFFCTWPFDTDGFRRASYLWKLAHARNNPHYFILLSLTNKMQRYTIFFITVSAVRVSGGFSAHHQELKTVHTASGICQACLLLTLEWVSWNSPTLALAASKLDIYQMLCVQFLAPDDGRRNRLKHVEH